MRVRAVAIAFSLGALIAGCGGGDRSVVASRRLPSASCVSAPGFGGLGARVGAFDANNNNTVGESGPTPGAAFYEIKGIEHGCISAFAVQDSAGPPLRGPQMLDLVSDAYLPRDAEQLARTTTCAVWRSAALKRALGAGYAQATAAAQTASEPGRAEIRVTGAAACYVGASR